MNKYRPWLDFVVIFGGIVLCVALLIHAGKVDSERTAQQRKIRMENMLKEQKILFNAWSKDTGNVKELTFEEWKALREDEKKRKEEEVNAKKSIARSGRGCFISIVCMEGE